MIVNRVDVDKFKETVACYAATFAKWAAMEGIILKSFKIKATAKAE